MGQPCQGVSTAMQVWGQEDRAEETRGWAEKAAGPRQGELEPGLQPAANCSKGDPAATASWGVCSSKEVTDAGEI